MRGRGIGAQAGAMAGQAGDALGREARRHGPAVIRAARAGYAAKGAIYLVIGGLALRAAAGSGGGTTDSGGALRVIGESAAGRALLVAMGIGLLGYALWALASAALDAEDRGGDAKGRAMRAGQAFRGLAYGVLGVEALRIARQVAGANGGGAAHWSARAMTMPLGRWLVALVGIGVIGYALYQFRRAFKPTLAKRLHLDGSDTSRWVLRLARFGIAARGVVFVLIGWFLVQAAWQREASRAGGIGDSLDALAAQSHGRLLLAVVAAGLVGYGVWELANARYREMRMH